MATVTRRKGKQETFSGFERSDTLQIKVVIKAAFLPVTGFHLWLLGGENGKTGAQAALLYLETPTGCGAEAYHSRFY